MNKEDKREKQILLLLNDEEFSLLNQKFTNSGCKHRNAFIRKMIFSGIIIRIDEKSAKKIMQLLSNISNNINQIAVRVNSTGNIYADDMENLKKGIDEIRQQQRYFLSLLQSQKR